MMDPEEPKFRWGQPVLAAVDLFNDGSFPEQPQDALLVPRGAAGEIVQIGAHIESRTTVYLVEFGAHRVVGCLEDEIEAVAPAVSPVVSKEGHLS